MSLRSSDLSANQKPEITKHSIKKRTSPSSSAFFLLTDFHAITENAAGMDDLGRLLVAI